MNEKLVENRNAKHAVQSASFNAQEKQEPRPSRTSPTSPAWQERSSANQKRSKKKKKILSDIRKKTETKNVKKSQNKALTRTERPMTIQIVQLQKRRRRKQNNGKITKIEEKMLKTKYSDKVPALFGSVSKHFVAEES